MFPLRGKNKMYPVRGDASSLQESVKRKRKRTHMSTKSNRTAPARSFFCSSRLWRGQRATAGGTGPSRRLSCRSRIRSPSGGDPALPRPPRHPRWGLNYPGSKRDHEKKKLSTNLFSSLISCGKWSSIPVSPRRAAKIGPGKSNP